MYDIIVVGNGALGLALGFRLAQSGQSVAVVGPLGGEFSASRAAGAMNGCFAEVTRELLSSSHGRKKLELDIEATALWDEWSEAVGEVTGTSAETLRRKTGTTVMLNAIGTAAIDTSNFVAIQNALDEYGAAYEELDGAEVPWIRPQESSRPFRAIHIPGEHSVDTPAYLSALTNAFRERGGHLVDGWVAQVKAPTATTSGSVTLADGTELGGQLVVLANGAFSYDLLAGALPDEARFVPPMVSGCGVSVLLAGTRARPMPHVLRTPNRAFACGLHAVPRNDSVYVGATNILSNKPQTLATVSDFHFLIECAMKQLHVNFASSRISAIQVGNRPVSIDGLPLIGKVGDTGLWMMTGTYRDGFHQSPLLATRLAKAILSGSDDEVLQVFAPVRAPIQVAPREESVRLAVEHSLATGFEADWRIPVKWSSRLRADLNLKYSVAADQLHDRCTPPPDILAFSFDNPWLQGKVRRYYDAYPAAVTAGSGGAT